MASKPMGPSSEEAHQVALFAWAHLFAGRYPDLRKLYAIPNGGKRDRVTAAKLKAQGVKAGVPDVALDVARGGFHGLRIELKRPSDPAAGKRAGQVSKEQAAWIADLNADGYLAVVCYGWEEARATLVRYLS